MGALKLTACMKVVSKMGEMDQESLLERLDRYTSDGVPKDRAQVMAASDTLAELIDERREFMAMLREQHPDLFRVTNAIPEDQDVDPDAPDIKRSADRKTPGAMEIEVTRGNDLYFPKGNEKGEFYEPLWIARSSGRSAHGQTPEEARKNLVTRLDENPDQDGDITRSPARDITNTPEFKRWFGDSKVVDVDGKPLVVYHGTVRDFSAFAKKGVQPNFTSPQKQLGFFFTDDPSYADRYTKRWGEFKDGANTMPVYLSLQNPKVEPIEKIGDIEDRMKQGEAKAYRAGLEAQGFDGIVFEGETPVGFVREFVAFRPEQIKSATGNNGQFDPKNADITRSPARNAMGFYSALAKGVEDMQTKSAPAGAWKTQIKGLVNKGQVKQDEIEWSGLEDFLDLQEGKVTKDQVLEYLRGNGVQVEEVVLGQEESGTDLDNWLESWADENTGKTARSIQEGNPWEETLAIAKREGRQEVVARIQRKTGPTAEYGKYTLPGGENYREVLLTLPERSDREMTYQVLGAYPRDGFKSREEAQAYIDSMTSNVEAALADPVRSEVGKVMQAELKKYPFKINEYESKESRSKDYHSNHWQGHANVLAHIRVNDRTDADGKRVLFVEEIQSDWGQDGKKKGIVKSYKPEDVQPIGAVEAGKMTSADEELFWHFKTPDNVFSIPKSKYEDRDAARDYIIREKKINSGGVPDAPFIGKTDGWLNLALKRVIAMAVDGGYDAVAFVNGDQSADRYDLSKQVQSLGYNPKTGRLQAFDDRRNTVIDKADVQPEQLEDYIGKEVAQRLLATEPVMGKHLLDGEQLKVGGEGMKAFYDKIVPNAVKALLKKTGGGQLDGVKIPLTTEQSTLDVIDSNGELILRTDYDSQAYAAAREYPGSRVIKTPSIESAPTQPGFTITDAMREKVSTEGLTLFSKRRNPQEDTPEFKAWFKGSKVVDKKGSPLIMYHGSDADISEFRPATYFSEDASEADDYASKNGAVYPVYISIKKPYEASDEQDFENRSELTEISEEYAEALAEDGYDGVIARRNGVTLWAIPFSAEQVKSATGNRGTFDPASGDITRSTGRTATGADWDSPSAEKFDDLVYKLQDKNIDTKRVVEAIKTASGSIADDLNVYLQEELYHGRAAKRTEDFVNMELNPLIEQMAKDGLKLEDVEEFMHARHAPEANKVIAQRNPGVQDLQDGGSGMKTGDALQYMATLPADLKQKLEAAAAKVDAIIAKTRELYVDYELESRETVDAWGKVFQHYIPLQREDKTGSPGLGQGFSVKGKETKGRTGSTRKVVDIMANIAMQREKAIVRGEKNRVSQALVGLAQANPNEGFWQVDEVPTERVFNEKTGLVEDRVDPLYKSRENAVIAKIADASGKVKEHAVLFNEEDPRALRMAQALKNLDAASLEGLMGVSAAITRYFAASVTQWNPLFGPVNLVRDVQAVALNLSSTPIKGDERKVMRNVMPALAGVYKDLRAARKGQSTNSQWAKLWDEFQEVGGQTGYRDLFKTSADRANAIKKTLDPDAWADSRLGKIFTAGGALKVPMAQARRAAGWIFDLLSDYNDALENGVRLAVYKAALDRGLSKERAASIAKNASTNFNRKGQIGQQAGAMYAFFNAAIQGTARIGDTLFDMEPGKPKTLRISSAGKKIVGGGILLGAVQAVMLAAAGFDDEDPPQFARERALIIPIGDKKYLSIPMPLGFNVIPNIGRISTEFAMGGFKNPHERAVQLISLFSETFNPIGSAGLSMQTLAPTALDPFVALTENKDWTGKPIARESSNKAIPGHALAKDTATTWSRAISEAINTMSGGNKYVAGVFSPTPDQIDYLLGWASGGVGREISKLDQTVTSMVSGEELPPYKIPLVGRFYGNARSQASEGTAFYANTAELNKIETEIKGLEKDGKRAEAAELRRSSDAYLITMANQAERQIQRLRSEKRELVKSGAPRDQVAAIDARITAVMARLNRAAESLREKSEK